MAENRKPTTRSRARSKDSSGNGSGHAKRIPKELFAPVSRDDLDEFIPSDVKGDQREAAIDTLFAACQAHERFRESRSPVEQLELSRVPVIAK